MTTVEELQARLRSPRSVLRAEDVLPADRLNGTTVVRALPDGRCEVWVCEDDVTFGQQTFGSEAEAVSAIAGRIFATTPQPASTRALTGPAPTTVEEVKDAFAELGRDPDLVTRAEVLRWSPQIEGLTVVESHPDGGVSTYVLERGREHDRREFPDEAAAVAPILRRLESSAGRTVPDLDVERMRARAARHRRLMASLVDGPAT